MLSQLESAARSLDGADAWASLSHDGGDELPRRGGRGQSTRRERHNAVERRRQQQVSAAILRQRDFLLVGGAGAAGAGREAGCADTRSHVSREYTARAPPLQSRGVDVRKDKVSILFAMLKYLNSLPTDVGAGPGARACAAFAIEPQLTGSGALFARSCGSAPPVWQGILRQVLPVHQPGACSRSPRPPARCQSSQKVRVPALSAPTRPPRGGHAARSRTLCRVSRTPSTPRTTRRPQISTMCRCTAATRCPPSSATFPAAASTATTPSSSPSEPRTRG